MATTATPSIPNLGMAIQFKTIQATQPLILLSANNFCFSSIINNCQEIMFSATPIILKDNICSTAMAP